MPLLLTTLRTSPSVVFKSTLSSASMDTLPLELLVKVVSLIAIKEKQLAPYATVSRAWQHVVEEHTFARLRVYSNELEKFRETIIESSHAHRRIAVRHVHFSIKLPDYDDKACGRFEREEDRRLNDEAFSQAFADLFAALAALGNAGDFKPIELLVHDFHSPMDIDQQDENKLRADKLAISSRKRNDVFELRYKSSHLQLLRSEELPPLKNVSSLTVAGDAARKLAPAVAASLTAKLPNLGSTE